MIINPFLHKEAMKTYEGTRILQQDFGLVGNVLPDLFSRNRRWTVSSLYAPISDRAIGGIRAKLIDNKDYITFINQMDLEVLLDVARPGMRCKWSGRTYAYPGEHDFYGYCVDDDDLIDDLYDRELLLRGSSPTGGLYPQSEIIRRIHMENRVDVEEYHLLLWDMDPETGLSPDTRIETLERRWSKVERLRAPWEDA
jgi:hypothetical protein